MNVGTENKEHHNLFSYLSPKQQNMIQKDFINVPPRWLGSRLENN